MTQVGLRVDVDTFRGTKLGVPALLRLFDKHSIAATFFFSVGPDNMGRHLFRVLRPAFFIKMLRSRAGSLYGWDIIFKGTVGPGPRIGKQLGHIIKSADSSGHEAGLHAWDHYSWQAHLDSWTESRIGEEIGRGFEELANILGRPPSCSATPGWKTNNQVLEEKARFPFRYNSDCRGRSVFRPVTGTGNELQPQIPSTLPTFDEVIGTNGINFETYNDFILSQIREGSLNVLTVHAEAEGLFCFELFDTFLTMASERGVNFSPLNALLVDSRSIDPSTINADEIPGREGWVAVQEQKLLNL